MIDISVIIPIHNGEKWINNCLTSILNQTILKSSEIHIEVVAFNDGSTDKTMTILRHWHEHFKIHSINLVLAESKICLGVGAAKNEAVKKSSGCYLCFQDIDDVMKPDRIYLQYLAAYSNHNALVGSKLLRVPRGSTPRYERWANELDESLLNIQIYTSNGPTLLMPTWFCHRSVFDKVGGFDESGTGTPEDLIFFYKHLDLKGSLIRVNKYLIEYTYHEGAATFSIPREKIWQLQINRIESIYISKWTDFTIWNAGKAGRRLVRALSDKSRMKIKGFCDVDQRKIGRIIELYCPKRRKNLITLPVIHFSSAKPPLIICVKLDLTGGHFENNLKSLNFVEGKDYILFS